MAAAQILVGLTTLTNSETATNFSRIGDTGGGGASSPGVNNEVYIQGSNSVTRLVRSNTGGTQVDLASESSTQTITTTDPRHFYVWIYNLANSSVDIAANGGYIIYLAGNGNENLYDQYYVGGFDELPGGGWKCYTASLRQSGAASAGTFGGQANLPSTVTHAGAESAMSATVSRFQNFALDSMFIGVGLTVYNGDSGAPAGITSFTSVNDNGLNRYGVCEKTSSGASIQGTLGIGLDDASTTDTYYSDSDIVILNPNKNPNSPTNLNTLSDFTGISIQGGLTTAFFTNVFFNSVDPYDKGYFSCNKGTNAPGNVDLDGCTFQKWGPTTLSGNTAATNTTWIGCEAVTLNSGTLDNCTVEAGIGGTYVIAGSTPNNISNTSFIGVNTNNPSATGYGHAIEITSSGSYDFVNNSFVGFDTTGSDGAAIHIDGSGLNVTLNISGNDATASPTYKLSNGANTPVFNAAVTVNVTGLPVVPAPQDATEIRVLLAGQNLFATSVGIGTTDVNAGVGTESHRTSTFSFGITKDIDIDLRIINLDYEPQFISSIRTANDPTNVSANLKEDRVSQNLKQ
jgi:hypothetical protein